jgi:type IV pilus assembly protein PilM
MLASRWKTMNQKVQPIGLDIGHSRVKMVQVALHEDRMTVLATRRVSVDPTLGVDTPERRRALVLAVRQLLAEGDFRGRNVVFAVPIDRIRITSLRLAEAAGDDVDQALRTEAAERFGLDPRIDAIDYLLAGSIRQGDEVKNEYILFAADNDTVRNRIALLEEAGLTPAGIDAPSCALFRTFERTMRRQEDREKTVIVLDVGYRSTIVVLGRADEICFVKHIPIGTSRFDEEVSSTLGIAVADAQLLRVTPQHDPPLDPATRCHLVDALNTVAEQLAGEVSLCLRYYTVTFRGKRVERAIIAGGGAGEPVLLDVLRRHLSIDIEIAAPLRGLYSGETGWRARSGESHADLALAVGLSLKGWHASGEAESYHVAEPVPIREGESS